MYKFFTVISLIDINPMDLVIRWQQVKKPMKWN